MTTPILQFFTYAHLPMHLQTVSQPFAALAGRISDFPEQAGPELGALIRWIEGDLPANPEATWAQTKLMDARRLLETGLTEEALRKVLEAKDCAVRALLYKSEPTQASTTTAPVGVNPAGGSGQVSP